MWIEEKTYLPAVRVIFSEKMSARKAFRTEHFLNIFDRSRTEDKKDSSKQLSVPKEFF